MVYLALVGMVGALSVFDTDTLPRRERWSLLFWGPLAIAAPVVLVLGTLYIISSILR